MPNDHRLPDSNARFRRPRPNERRHPAPAAPAIGVMLAIGLAGMMHAADCTNTSTGLVPLTDLGTASYLGLFQGGLYPGGVNVPPVAHHQLARANALQILPRLPDGSVHLGAGRIVLLSIGMSNTSQEFCSGGGPPCSPGSFTGQAIAHPDVDHQWLSIVDGAAGGQTAGTWDDPADANYDRVRDMELAPQGLSESQVQVVWIKVANAAPGVSLPAANADAIVLSTQIASIARAVHIRYPNCRLAFLSSRIYAGYASTPLNPEPYAYESGFAVKWAIGEQIAQDSGALPTAGFGPLVAGADAPVLVWGPYLWADGLEPSGSGLSWACGDLGADGTHPSPIGVAKVGQLLLAFLLDSPYSRVWFRAVKPADFDDDGLVNGDDLGELLGAWGPCGGAGTCPQDLDWDGVVNGSDLGSLLAQWSP